MRKKISKTVILLLILISIYVAFIFFSDVNVIYESLTNMNPLHFLIAVILYISGNFIKSIRWHLFLKEFDDRIPFKQNFKYYLAGFAFAISPGRFGEIVRSPYIQRDYGISISKTTSIVLVERFYDILGLTIVFAIGLSLVEFSTRVLLVPLIIIILFILILKNKKKLLKLMNLLSKIKLLKNLDSNVDEIYDSILKLMKIKFFLLGCGISTVSFLLFTIAVYFLISGLGANLSFQEILVIFPSSMFIAAVSFIPAGIGVLEGGMIGLLTLYDVQYEIAIATTMLMRIIGIGIISVIGFYFLKIISKNNSK